MERWPLVEEEILDRSPIFTLSRSLRRRPATGSLHRLWRLDCPDWVNVVALTAAGELILVEQYRHGTDAITLEIPGGAVDAAEDPGAAAARELEEETGYRAATWHCLGVVEPNPAFLANRCFTYLALGCTPSGTAAPDPGEEIVLRLATLAGFAELIALGHIRHSLVIAAHYHLLRGLATDAAWADEVRRLGAAPSHNGATTGTCG